MSTNEAGRSAEIGAWHWGDIAASQRHYGTAGECPVPTCTAMPERVVAERVPHIVGDVVGDHRPVDGIASDLVTCRCDGTVWEVQDWQRHVGNAVVTALAEDRAAYSTPPAKTTGEADV